MKALNDSRLFYDFISELFDIESVFIFKIVKIY